jgi:glycosyltransferase involved in cell wall biosynthesis
LDSLLERHDVVHVQNVMNPVVLAMAVTTDRAVATIQDHRVFCPSIGKTMPDGSRCQQPMSPAACRACVDDREYLDRTLELTQARRDALRGARLVVLSTYMAEELAIADLPGAEVLPPWVEVGALRREPGESFLIGGRLVVHKGVMDGWRAWRTAAGNLSLRVAGEGPLAGQMDGAEHLGWLRVPDLRLELRSSRALLFPAVWQEPFGILGVQAQAEGTPVVVADVGGTTDWSDVGCIRVPAGDVDAMVAAVSRLEHDPDEALRLGRRGQSMVIERFARSTIEPRVHALYQEICS